MALVSRLFVHRHTKDNQQHVYAVDGDNAEAFQQSRKSSLWRHLFSSKQKDSNSKWVPTLSGMVKAGDEGLWSSALFTSPQGHPGDVSFEAICNMFANELRPQSTADRSAYSGEIGKFLNSAKRSATSPKRVQSMSHKKTSVGRGDMAPPMQRKSLDLSAAERGTRRSLSIKRPAPVLVAMGNGLSQHDTASTMSRTWMKDGRPADYYDGRMGVRLTSAELVTLSVLLGTSIKNAATNSQAVTEVGAFSITIWSTQTDDGRSQVSLVRHRRQVSRLPPSGSGHSLLFAKHLAHGSLPFSQDTKSISSILITNDAFEAVRSGAPLTIRKRSQQTQQAKGLALLPSSRELVFHAIETSTKSSPSTPLVDAIARLPFIGGLTPLASAPLINTVQFVASGGLVPARLLQRLEGLVDKVHRHSPEIDIFGPLYRPHNAGLLFRERERLGKLAAGTVDEALIDKVARMQRYITLLERLMALVPDLKPQDVLVAVQEATKKELQRSYLDALSAHTSAARSSLAVPLHTVVDTHCPESDARSRRHSSSSPRPSARRSRRSSLNSDGSVNSSVNSRNSSTYPKHNIGKQVESLLKESLPFSVDTIATVARLVIVAWTLSVERVAWEEEEEGFRVPDIESLPSTMLLI